MRCKECDEETDEPVVIKIERRSVRLCESCADELRETEEIAGEAESAMQAMMEYRGRR